MIDGEHIPWISRSLITKKLSKFKLRSLFLKILTDGGITTSVDKLFHASVTLLLKSISQYRYDRNV